ncbi:MAG: DUF1127 domain-containing protein [Rhizobiaceae bacterium]
MTTFEHGQMFAAAVRQPVAVRLVNLVVGAFRSWKNRRDFERLGQFSDAELADIGLRRVDLHAVDDLPFFVDPTRKLGAIAEARARRGERAARQIC